MNHYNSDEFNKEAVEERFLFRDSFLRRIFKKSGWYVVSSKGSHGPYNSEKIAREIFFFDKFYG